MVRVRPSGGGNFFSQSGKNLLVTHRVVNQMEYQGSKIHRDSGCHAPPGWGKVVFFKFSFLAKISG